MNAHEQYKADQEARGWHVYAYGHREFPIGDGRHFWVHPLRAVAEPALPASHPGKPNDGRYTYHARFHPNPADLSESETLGFFASEAEAQAACESQARLRAEHARMWAAQTDYINRRVWHQADALGNDLVSLRQRIRWAETEIHEQAMECLRFLAGPHAIPSEMQGA